MQVTRGIWSVDGVRASHVYLVTVADGVVVVDSGAPGSAQAIESEIRAAGFSASEVRAIVITHAHVDHIGSLHELQRALGAPVLAPHGEAEAIEGTRSLPSPPGLHGAILGLMNARFRPPPVAVARRIEANTVLPEMPGWYVIGTPGHTPGHISLHHPERQLLIAGDALFHLGGVGGSPWLFTSDTRRAAASVAMLAGLPVRTALFGHGEPIVDDARLPEQIAAAALPWMHRRDAEDAKRMMNDER